jgi:kynurenine formamidase
VHGGAWRDPELTATSIEAAVAHAFSSGDESMPITAVASSTTRSPSSRRIPPSRTTPVKTITRTRPEALHPQHVSDVLRVCVCSVVRAHRRVLRAIRPQLRRLPCVPSRAPVGHYGLDDIRDASSPAALICINGLYDLPELEDGIGASHQHLRDAYVTLLSHAFGADRTSWSCASPARFDPETIARRVRDSQAPALVVLDQSAEDQLVPMNQKERFEANLSKVNGLRVVTGRRCTGKHAAPWEEGLMIWQSVRDMMRLLLESNGGAV